MTRQKEAGVQESGVVQITLPFGTTGVHVLFDASPITVQTSRQNTIDTLRSAISEKKPEYLSKGVSIAFFRTYFEPLAQRVHENDFSHLLGSASSTDEEDAFMRGVFSGWSTDKVPRRILEEWVVEAGNQSTTPHNYDLPVIAHDVVKGAGDLAEAMGGYMREDNPEDPTSPYLIQFEQVAFK